MHEHPLIPQPPGSVRQITDFISLREWKRRSLYAGFYRLVDVENSMCVRLATSRPVDIVIASLRGARDYSERERLILQLAEPHLARAYANAEAATVQAGEVSLLRQGILELGGAAIVLARDDRIRLVTERARHWLAEYFGASLATALLDEIAPRPL